MGGMGTSVVVALAAVLWLVYLVPTWLRRREYLATELNAVRLQQTLRILAETAEVPEQVRVEATAREVAQRQSELRLEQERQEAIARARAAAMREAATRTLASLKPAVASGVVAHSLAARRLRRTRRISSAVLLVAVLMLVVMLTPVGAVLAAGMGIALAATAASLAVGSLLMLQRLASVARRRAAVARSLVQVEAPRVEEVREAVVEQRDEKAWTPVPLPKPLYLSRPAPQPLVSEAAIAEARERALAAVAEEERRAIEAEQAEKVIPIARPAASASRFARMGIIDQIEDGGTVIGLDEALRRRRAV